jgi:two-component system nitrate/nitrite sensor histidine kinase NarX
VNNRARWLLILVPALVVGAIEIVSDQLLDEAFAFPVDTLVVVAVTLVLGGIFGALAFGRIDTLTGALRRRNQELEARETSARALHRVSVALASLTDVERVLDAIVTHTRELLRVDAVVLLLAGPDGRVALRAASAIPGALVATPPAPGADPADAPEVTAADQILRFVVPASAVARVAAPLQRGGTTIGLLAVGAAEARSFDADAVETLSSLANQATIALENARLEARLRELAVVGERERIARELHDGLSQVLGYVNTKSQAVDGFLAVGRVDEARAQLGELSAAARSVYVDVRETILGLRSPIGPASGLVAAIRAHAAGVAESAKLAIRVHAAPEVEAARLEPEVETQAFRIVAEALTNVRKHAGARRVTIDLRSEADRLIVAIRDDGRGFTAGGPGDGRPHYGLRSMTERAAGIGGTLDLENAPDGGAVVRLAAPFRPVVETPGVLPPDPMRAEQPMPAQDATPGATSRAPTEPAPAAAVDLTPEPSPEVAPEPTPGPTPGPTPITA